MEEEPDIDLGIEPVPDADPVFQARKYVATVLSQEMMHGRLEPAPVIWIARALSRDGGSIKEIVLDLERFAGGDVFPMETLPAGLVAGIRSVRDELALCLN
ncbi:MAG: hypothetical protein RLW87_20650 [Alphaproteobacteria bacterium]